MSTFDDDDNVNPRRTVEDRTADLLLSGHDVPSEAALGTFLAELRDLGSAPAPTPNLALAAMLEGGLPAPALVPAAFAPVTTWTRLRGAVSWRTASGEAVSWRTASGEAARGRRRSWALPMQLSLAGTGCLALVLVAASTNQLPDAAQTAVANVVEAITPLDLPRPGDDHPTPAVSPTPSPEPGSDGTTGAGASDDGTGPGRGGRGELGVDNRDDHATDAGDDSRRDGDGDSTGADEGDDRSDSDRTDSDSDSGSDSDSDSDSDSGSDADADADSDRTGSDDADSGAGSGSDRSRPDSDSSDSSDSDRSGSDSPDSSGSGGSDSQGHN